MQIVPTYLDDNAGIYNFICPAGSLCYGIEYDSIIKEMDIYIVVEPDNEALKHWKHKFCYVRTPKNLTK